VPAILLLSLNFKLPKVTIMRKFVSLVLLSLATAPVFAGGGLGTVPEPEVLSLLGIGVLAFFASRRIKK
jgi:hypothetical protein